MQPFCMQILVEHRKHFPGPERLLVVVKTTWMQTNPQKFIEPCFFDHLVDWKPCALLYASPRLRVSNWLDTDIAGE